MLRPCIITAYNIELRKNHLFRQQKAISIGPALVDIMSSSSAESTDYYLRQLFRSVKQRDNYMRIEPNNLSSILPSMDAASPSNI